MDATHNYKLPAPNGRTIEVDYHKDGTVVRLDLGDGRSLCLESHTYGNHVGYRDGVAESGDKLAIVVDKDGSVSLTAVLVERAESVVRVPLDRLEELLKDEPTVPGT